MKTSQTILTLFLALSLSAFVNAQGSSLRDDPRQLPERRHREEVSLKASALTGKARILFRRAQYVESEHLATEALSLCEPLNMSCGEGDEILAELAMLRKDPKEALRVLHDAPEMPDGVLTFRGMMTRALALLAVGRTQDAQAALIRAAGTSDGPSDWRGFPGSWDLPMDSSSSTQALAATAYILRGSHQMSMPDPEVLEDLRQAEKLAPASLAVRLMIADQLMRTGRFEEAQPYYERVAAINRTREREEGKRGLERVRKAIEWRRSQKPGG